MVGGHFVAIHLTIRLKKWSTWCSVWVPPFSCIIVLMSNRRPSVGQALFGSRTLCGRALFLNTSCPAEYTTYWGFICHVLTYNEVPIEKMRWNISLRFAVSSRDKVVFVGYSRSYINRDTPGWSMLLVAATNRYSSALAMQSADRTRRLGEVLMGATRSMGRTPQASPLPLQCVLRLASSPAKPKSIKENDQL